MTSNRDFKRLVRGRMQKTGESYTAARSRLLIKPTTLRAGVLSILPAQVPVVVQASPVLVPELPPRKAAPAAPDYAKLAGMSDAALKAKTGCTWERWVWALDKVEAHTWPHRKIAEYVQQKYKVQDWWTQTVTVGYERIKGLREIGQRRGGSFEATRSRTFAAPVADVYRAFADARRRSRWLPGVKVTMRKATLNKSVRITWDDETTVEVWLIAKGTKKAQAAIAHRKLRDKESVVRMKAYWGERLDALEGILSA